MKDERREIVQDALEAARRLSSALAERLLDALEKRRQARALRRTEDRLRRRIVSVWDALE